MTTDTEANPRIPVTIPNQNDGKIITKLDVAHPPNKREALVFSKISEEAPNIKSPMTVTGNKNIKVGI
jgi:hypothetical protein